MPIRQTPSVTEHNRASRLFTDRLAERRLFARYLHADPPPERLLFFHGDGGNGKSLLLKLLRTRHSRRLKPADWARLDALADDRAFVEGFEAIAETVAIPCIYHDFDAPGSGEDRPREDWSALLMLRREFGVHRIKLPLFDFAVMLFLHKRGQLSPERIRTLFPQEESDFAASLFDLITNQDIPFLGLAVKVIGLFSKHLKTNAALWLAKRGLDEARVRALQRMDPGSELRDQLPRILGEDLNAAMQLPGAPPRVLLLFDTHEAFWGTERHLQSTDSYFQRDEWLRQFLAELYRPNQGIVIAVAGREPPRWADAPPKTQIPRDCIDTQLVGHLDRADADTYLTLALEPMAGVDSETAQALRAAMIRHAEVAPGQVHPLYLGITADLVLRAYEGGKTLTADAFTARPGETPGDTPDETHTKKMGSGLVTRLLRYCPHEVAYAVTALAAARRFDRDLFYAMGQRLHFQASAPAFDNLISFSFVWRDLQPGRAGYRIHDLLRRLLADVAAAQTLDAHAALEAIFRERAQTNPEAIAEAIYHANRRDWEQGYGEWLVVMDNALTNGRYALCEALAELRPVLRLATPVAHATLASLIGDLASRLSCHQAAAAALRDAVESFDHALGDAPEDISVHSNKGNALTRLGDLRAGLSDHAGAEAAYTAAIAAYDEALSRAPDCVQAHHNKGNALWALGVLRAGLSDHAGAETASTAAIVASDEALSRAPDLVEAHNNKGNAFCTLGDLRAGLSDHAGAEAAYTAAIAAYDEALSRASDLVMAQNNKGNALWRIGDVRTVLRDHAGAESAYTAAIAAYDEALSRAPDLVEAHNNKGSALLSLGVLRAGLSNAKGAQTAYTAAIAAFDEALSRARDFVMAHNNKGNALRRLGDLRAGLSDHAGAEAAYTAAIAAYDEALSRAPDYVLALCNKGGCLLSFAFLGLQRGSDSAACKQLLKAKALMDRALVLAPSRKVTAAGAAFVEQLLGQFCPPP